MGRDLLANGNPGTRVVFGLGNAEPRYARTRHNIGAQAAARAAAELGLRAAPGLVAVPGARAGLVLPTGFMNESGTLARRAIERWHPAADALLVVHDDLDLPLGTVRLKDGGGHGGHNGLRDVMAVLGSGAFQRVRIGIGRPPPGMDAADFVLAGFLPDERPYVEDALTEAAREVLAFLAPELPELSR